MRIHKISTLLYILIALIAAFILYYSSTIDRSYSLWILAPAIGMATVYVFTNLIDNWWWDRNPPKLDSKLIDWLKQYSVFYNGLSADDQSKFQIEMSVFMETNIFYIVGKDAESVPYDIKGIVSHEAVKLIHFLGRDSFKHINRIVLYKHAFPSPKLQYLHTVESDMEDGVLIFSLEHLIPGLLSPHIYYNIAMHGYLNILKDKPWKDIWNISNKRNWESVYDICNLKEDFIRTTLGLKDVDIDTVLTNMHLTYPLKSKDVFLQSSEKLQNIFSDYN